MNVVDNRPIIQKKEYDLVPDLIAKAQKFCFIPSELARCYRAIGYYGIVKEDYRLAMAGYLTSTIFDANVNITNASTGQVETSTSLLIGHTYTLTINKLDNPIVVTGRTGLSNTGSKDGKNCKSRYHRFRNRRCRCSQQSA